MNIQTMTVKNADGTLLNCTYIPGQVEMTLGVREDEKTALVTNLTVADAEKLIEFASKFLISAARR